MHESGVIKGIWIKPVWNERGEESQWKYLRHNLRLICVINGLRFNCCCCSSCGNHLMSSRDTPGNHPPSASDAEDCCQS